MDGESRRREKRNVKIATEEYLKRSGINITPFEYKLKIDRI